MKARVLLNINELKDSLLNFATVKPIFIWGPPGIGKSSTVEQFCEELGMECVTLMGSNLAPEDIIGIPQIKDNVSRFIPPSMIVRDKPFVLFLDELNGASAEVQKSFYSLILDQRVGEYHLPKGSIIIGAGNRAADSALVRQLPSALINRMVHVHLKVDHRIWLEWAKNSNQHQLVIDYIQTRPSHLSTEIPPSSEDPFSTPRSWSAVSACLNNLPNQNIDLIFTPIVQSMLYGSLTESHAQEFTAFVKKYKYKYSITKLISGDEDWPNKPEDRDILMFLVKSFREHLVKELPKNENEMTSKKKEFVVQVKNSLKKLSLIDNEYCSMIIAPDDGAQDLPKWFMIDLSKELPKLLNVIK